MDEWQQRRLGQVCHLFRGMCGKRPAASRARNCWWLKRFGELDCDLDAGQKRATISARHRRPCCAPTDAPMHVRGRSHASWRVLVMIG